VGVGSITTYVHFRLHERFRNGAVCKSETVCSYFLMYFVRNLQYHVMEAITIKHSFKLLILNYK